MTTSNPYAWGAPPGTACLRTVPSDFRVEEELGFEPEGAGEHLFLYIEKIGLSTTEVAERIARLARVPRGNLGYSGLKDRQAITRQWFSVGLAGVSEPDWRRLEADGDLLVLVQARHRKKLRRGVHRANRFTLVLRELAADVALLEARLEQVRLGGVPNYFGPQRFGRGGSTLEQARQWLDRGAPRVSRNRRSLYLSAARASLFNRLLSQRVEDGTWNEVIAGDACMLDGTRSLFGCAAPDDDIAERCLRGDLHPALPLWGVGRALTTPERHQAQRQQFGEDIVLAQALEELEMSLSYRAARLVPDDFCWEFCDDGCLKLSFGLGAGGYATAVVLELLDVSEGDAVSGDSGE